MLCTKDFLVSPCFHKCSLKCSKFQVSILFYQMMLSGTGHWKTHISRPWAVPSHTERTLLMGHRWKWFKQITKLDISTDVKRNQYLDSFMTNHSQKKKKVSPDDTRCISWMENCFLFFSGGGGGLSVFQSAWNLRHADTHNHPCQQR